jgi:hypothetical protein
MTVPARLPVGVWANATAQQNTSSAIAYVDFLKVIKNRDFFIVGLLIQD